MGPASAEKERILCRGKKQPAKAEKRATANERKKKKKRVKAEDFWPL